MLSKSVARRPRGATEIAFRKASRELLQGSSKSDEKKGGVHLGAYVQSNVSYWPVVLGIPVWAEDKDVLKIWRNFPYQTIKKVP